MQLDSEANNTEQLNGDERVFLNDKRVGQKDIEKPVDDQNIRQQLAEKLIQTNIFLWLFLNLELRN